MKGIKTPMQSRTPQKVRNTKRHLLLRRRKWNNTMWFITGSLAFAFLGCSFIPMFGEEITDIHLTHKEMIHQDSHVYLAGVVHDATKISPIVLKVLVELNCIDGIGIHIFTSEPHPPGVIEKHRSKYDNCAPFIVLRENPDLIARFPKRMHRIALIRDLQRQMLQNLFRGRALENDVIIVADFDLYQFPSRSLLAREIDRLVTEKDRDVICSAGEMSNPWFGYYDIFATVLLPNTFVYPLAGRYRKKYNKGENRSLVRSDDVFGSFTQRDLMEYFEEEAKKAAGTVPVRSCFGGLALYRASKFFKPECGYNNVTKRLMQFANHEDAIPCEHVIFHECLRGYDPSIHIAVNPSLKPMWKPPEPYYSNLKSGGTIANGLKHSDGLVTFARSPGDGSRLVNGDYCLRINEKGSLVIEHWPTSKSYKTVWRAEANRSMFNHDWTIMFLILDNDGLLKLVQQVEARPVELNSAFCEPVEPSSTICRVVVWTSEEKGEPWPSPGRYVLVLGNDGSLQIYDAVKKQIMWTNSAARENHHLLLDDEARTPRAYAFNSYWHSMKAEDHGETTSTCISSGEERAINQALQSPGAEAVLCQGAIFNIQNPIIFSHDYQQIYTRGRPTGEERAVIRVSGTSVVEAVVMVGRSHAKLSNVIIDGNRPGLGEVPPTSTQFGGGLIFAGGSAIGQVISNVKAYEPRGPTCLHLHEGDPSLRCNGAVVIDNTFGPSGEEDGATASGISVACSNSTVSNNFITDATDVGIGVYGAPGSLIEGNTIMSTTRKSLGGIKMVDYDPYDGNFTGTVVQNNTIDARHVSIRVGIAMGQHIWFCHNLNRNNRQLFGAVVTRNSLTGNYMRHGFAVDGVLDWVVTGNVDTATHKGWHALGCNERTTLFPNGFQINRQRSEGIFQDEFTDLVMEKPEIGVHPMDWWISRDWKSLNRSQRFPSVEERVKVYMSNWYHAPCPKATNAGRLTYRYGIGTNGTQYWPQVTVQDNLLPFGENSVNISGLLASDTVLLIDQDQAHKCAQGFSTLRSYCNNSMELLTLRDNAEDFSNLSRAPTDVPLFAYFGDEDIDTVMAEILEQGSVLIPTFSKFRNLATGDQLDKVNGIISSTIFDGTIHPRMILQTIRHNVSPSPIVWKLNTRRHWHDIEEARRNDTVPWELKKNAAIWRGDLTGEIPEDISDPEEKCRINLRCNFVLHHSNSTLVDAGFTNLTGEIDMDVSNEMKKLSPLLSFKEIQAFKIIISLEGNDVASGLKWQLLSSSVVLMPQPTRTSWLMEELLEPWIHYIPLDADGSNAEEMVQWVLENDDKARQISKQATLYMEDLLYHPDAQQDEREIKKEIMRRYKAWWA